MKAAQRFDSPQMHEQLVGDSALAKHPASSKQPALSCKRQRLSACLQVHASVFDCVVV